MRAVGLHEFGGPEVLRVIELPEPHAGPGEVRVRVHAAAVNPSDTLLRSGVHASALAGVPGPYVPGMDVAGVIDEIGPRTVTDLSVGDQVMAMLLPVTPTPEGTLENSGGGYVEYVVRPASWVVRAPAGVSHEAAATLPMNGLTALLALDQLALAPGSTLAVVGAAGALGSYLVQMASNAGLTVVADAAPADEALVRESGAAIVVARGSEVVKGIQAHFPDGVDAVADVALLGPALFDVVRDGGTLLRIRHADEPGGYQAESTRDIRVLTPFVPDYAGRTDKLDEIRRLAEAGVLIPRVAKTLTAAEAPDAHRRFAAGGVRGRLVLTF
ncbi:NADPH:quinone reductase-like Zn-dependent oxidoreductase [Micromonospora violae]|uniref:NADPH:quinone reductase-like Zn-dependent oxidoreductase n=1 Tax=Micromonospora violae TaxID=1278207 RepID=A0A4Q7UJ80_9ACTN|nr:NADP-dependent oxidoreductase [Micromonospora violae]RZT79603.1 NADPH:quinone reductase-like Zn-dependent oxidoreductase [Micromonospora violae]